MNLNLRERFEKDIVEALEVPRGFLHFGFCVTFAFLSLQVDSQAIITIVAAILFIVLLVLELQKTTNGFLGRLFVKIGRPFMRKSELSSRYTAAISTLLALIFVTAFYSQTAVFLSLLFLSTGDPVARGTRKILAHFGWSFVPIQVISFIVVAVTCTTISLVFSDLAILKAVFAGLAAAFAETFLEIKVSEKLTIDDNFFIPVFSGFAIMTFLN